MQGPLWIGVSAMVALVGVSGVAEWRRGKRRDLDRVGWVPWTFIQVMALLLAIAGAALALKGG
ncbi:MAG: hypothetical protein ACK4GG_05205 [Sphingomonas sp.]